MPRTKGAKDKKPRSLRGQTLDSKQIRISASPEEMTLINTWLEGQAKASQRVAQILLRYAKRAK
jgi:hypothetical protein